MRALLMILIPMLALAGVMSLVFYFQSDPGDAPADVEQPAAGQPPDEQPIAAGSKDGDRPPTKTADRPEPKPPSTQVAKAAETIDEMVTISRVRARRDREQQLERVRRALGTKQPAKALDACNRMLEAHPKDADFLAAKGDALAMLKRFDEAAKAYESAIEVKPDDGALHYSLGVLLERLGQRSEALRRFERTRELWPDNTRVMYVLAKLYQEEGKLSDAAKLWQQVTKLEPKDSGAWFNRGTVAIELGQYEQAVEALKRADELKPGEADTRTNLGIAYQELGRPNEAIAAFRRALEVDAKYLPAVNGIADVYVKFYEEHKDSEEYLKYGLSWCKYSRDIEPFQMRLIALHRRLVKTSPTNVEAVNGLIHALAATPKGHPSWPRHKEEILKLCEQSLETKSDQPEIRALLEKLSAES